MLVYIILIIIGFVMLIKGADILVEGAEDIATILKIPKIIIGLTLVSIGTSLPELIISVQSATKGLADISIGNVIGSCICNLLLVLGATTIVKPIFVEENTRKSDLPISLISIFLIAVFGNFSNQITKHEGVLLLMFLGIFIFQLFIRMNETNKNDNSKIKNISDTNNEISLYEKYNNDGSKLDKKVNSKSEKEIKENKKLNEKFQNKDPKNTEQNHKKKILKDILFILGGIILLKYGGDFVVDNSSNVAKLFGLSDRLIGLTIISIGTSLPELVTGVVAAINGDEDIAVGNVIGSNILNLLLVLGVTAIINPISYTEDFNINIIILFLASFIIWSISILKKEHKLGRIEGIAMLSSYILYLISLW